MARMTLHWRGVRSRPARSECSARLIVRPPALGSCRWSYASSLISFIKYKFEGSSSSSTLLSRQQGFTGSRSVIEHGPPGAPALDQAGIEQDLEVTAHRAKPLAGQCHQLRRAFRGFQEDQDACPRGPEQGAQR